MNLTVGMFEASLDFAVMTSRTFGFISYYTRSLSEIKAIAGNLGLGNLDIQIGDSIYKFKDRCTSYITPITNGKDKFYHAISVNKSVNDDLLVLELGKEGEQFYNYLMGKFDFPLLEVWGNELYTYAMLKKFIHVEKNVFIKGEYFDENKVHLDLSKIQLVFVDLDEDKLKSMIFDLFQMKKIWISKEKQNKLEFENMDDYFSKYGKSIVKNLTNHIEPLTELDGEAHDFTLKSMRLYPQQLAQVNGAVRLLETGKYGIINHDMGTGKTIVSASICESYFVRKWLRKNPKASLQEAYNNGQVKYRNIVMCPGHLVEKWAKELISELPFAQVTILRDLSQLMKLKESGSERCGKEWYVMSKDFGKLSYQKVPVPKKMGTREIKLKHCNTCAKDFNTPGSKCPTCGDEFSLLHTGSYDRGMICPSCNNLLFPYNRAFEFCEDDEDNTKPLLASSFKAESNSNRNCFYCGAYLWQPFVANIGNENSCKWVRATHYTNRAKKGTKTVWVHTDYKDEYFSSIRQQPLKVFTERKGARKYAPAEYIKRHLKGFFDIAIFDEVHELKGGGTGQGQAMHSLVKASKKQLALTGTIAAGYANNLFYILYRLDPARMKNYGYAFKDELAFSFKYGKVETCYEYSGSNDGEFKVSCKGQQKSSPTMKPGISPLIYTDFLLDKTTNLDLSDMSKFLPPLKEFVVGVKPCDDEIFNNYRRTISILKERAKLKGNFGLLSNMLQFSLSYLDKPYDVSAIRSPLDGSVVAQPLSFDNYRSVESFDGLLSKEKELVKLVKKELEEDRNCFVYAEYTASPETCVTYRLKEILERFCGLKGKVAVLESNSPSAKERERWIHSKAKAGVKVFITNPRCTATGLDFCFTENSVTYNYPTIIFYQMGYNMFVVWQASRRHYRLNQKKECRTYYMAWEGSAQMAAINLIAEKQVATSAIQGHFSAEGLAAMANGTDARMKMAQSMSNLDTFTGNKLQEMFDVIGNKGNEEDCEYKKMVLFNELISQDAILPNDENMSFDDTVFLPNDENSSFDSEGLLELFNVFDFYEPQSIPVPEQKQRKRSNKKQLLNQMSLFA